MRKAIATVLLTVGLATQLTLLANGVGPSADPEAEVTFAFLAGIVAAIAGGYLFWQVGLERGRHGARLAKLASFQMEAKNLFDRAVAVRDDEPDGKALAAEAETWEVQVRDWLRANMPIYESVFVSKTREATITYIGVPTTANQVANWAQERQHRLGEIIHTLARAEVD